MEEKYAFQKWRLIRFLRKVDYFSMLPYIIYSFFVNCMSVFVDYQKLKISVPLPAVIAGCALILLVSIFVFTNYHKDTTNTAWMIIFLSWYAIIPIIYNIILIIIIGLGGLYSFSGIILGGLDQGIFRIVIIVVCILALILFAVIRLLFRKSQVSSAVTMFDGNDEETEYVDTTKDFINLGVLGVILLAIIGTSIYSGAEYYQEVQQKKRMEVRRDFRNEMLDKLPSGNGIDEVYSDAKLICMKSESVSDGEITFDEMYNDVKKETICTKINEKTLLKGVENYTKFKNDYDLKTCFHDTFPTNSTDINKRIFYVYFCGKSGAGEWKKDCSFVCAYDEDWNLLDVFCMEGYISDTYEY